MANVQLSPTAEFINAICKDADLAQEVYPQIPQIFVNQALTGLNKFAIDGSLVSPSRYFGVNLIEPKLMDEEGNISFIFVLQGIMDYSTGEMVALSSSREKNPNHKWLNGFRSNRLQLGPEDVTNGSISKTEYDGLVFYTELWAKVSKDYGDNAMFNDDNFKKERIWINFLSVESQIQFLMELRTSPSTNKTVIGLTDFSWDRCELAGTGIKAKPTKIGKAGNLSKGTGLDHKVVPFRVSEIVEDIVKEEDPLAFSAASLPSRRV